MVVGLQNGLHCAHITVQIANARRHALLDQVQKALFFLQAERPVVLEGFLLVVCVLHENKRYAKFLSLCQS